MKRHSWKPVLLFATLCTLLGCVSVKRTAVCNQTTDYENNICLPDIEGKYHLLSEYAGNKAILLYFWSLYDGPGLKLLDKINKISAKYKQNGIAFVAIVERVQGDSVEDVVEYIEKKNIHIQVLLDYSWQSLHASGIKDVCFYESSCGVLLDRNGNIAWKFKRAHPGDYKEYERAIEQYLAEQ